MKRGLRSPLLRGIDANLNRAKEALRVLEDIARFFLKNAKLTAELKKTRHDFSRAILKFPLSYREFLEARDSAGDVGKETHLQDSVHTEFSGVWISNMKRAQEASRVLEEFSKIFNEARSADFQRIRFSLYELEKKSFRLF